VTEARETEIAIRGGSLQSGVATVLAHADIHAHNSFAQRDVVRPRSNALEIKGRNLFHVFAPVSVTKLALRLG